MRPLGKVEGHAAGVVFQLRTLIHFIVALLRWMVDNITEFIEREIRNLDEIWKRNYFSVATT